MILSAKAIKEEIRKGRLRIEPAPDPVKGFDSDSINVHMGNKLYEWRPKPSGMTTALRLGAFQYRDLEKDSLITLTPDADGIITMRPERFYQADLLEYIWLPSDICAHIEGKSSLARVGLQIHITAPHAHAGWDGRLKLEMINHGPFNLEITSGFEIGQMFFYRIEDPEAEVAYRGQFTSQDGRIDKTAEQK